MARFQATTALLGNAGVFVGDTLITDLYDTVGGTVFASHNGTLYVEQSTDGTNWDLSESIAVTGGTGAAINKALVAPYFRIRYVNGATPQTTFRLRVKATAAGTR